MLYFFDTSALVKHYHWETGSAVVSEIFESRENRILIASLSLSEFVSALNRVKNHRLISGLDFQAAVDRFTADISSGRIGIVDINRTHILASRDLIIQFNLTAADAIILASSLGLREFEAIFVCADIRSGLLHAAEACKLSTLNPLSH